MDKLIDLIEKGDADKILSEEDLFPKFNRLVKYGLVVLKDEKVFLTEKGIQGKKEGVEAFIKKEELARIQNQHLQQENSNKKGKRFFKRISPPKLIHWGYLMILLALALGNKLYQLKIRGKFKK
ncbi:hypothetical protein [Gillisia limnaea]|uniref:Uncharacterized protein n=1 Tax=Gillisia limnaea (strain DSM 15749 / LMG 21470 / R-8282) TaxID=865937 RepID=H2BVP3_GILLR|nr:hypothetical protein [Gillisia limnaea]EHQ03999.1 hypothetical protein Gilli_3399 [Gillisia limnaea DSM 15749]